MCHVRGDILLVSAPEILIELDRAVDRDGLHTATDVLNTRCTSSGIVWSSSSAKKIQNSGLYSDHPLVRAATSH